MDVLRTSSVTQHNICVQQPNYHAQFYVLVGEKRAAGMNKHRQLQHLPVTKTVMIMSEVKWSE